MDAVAKDKDDVTAAAADEAIQYTIYTHKCR